MKHLRITIALLCATLVASGCGGEDKYSPAPFNPGKGGKEKPEPKDSSHVTTYYQNPVWKTASSPDPTVIKVGKVFYSYSTGNLVRILKSTNLVQWTEVGRAFTEATRPNWIKDKNGGNVGIWAPDIEYIDGQYVLYYGLSGTITGFGAATSSSPEGPFTDRGAIVNDNITGTTGNVDQFYFKDPVTGIQWMGWGSYGGNTGGIHIAELSDDGLSLKPGATIHRIAGSAWEGGQMYYHKGTYYFFGSGGYCCSGENSTYNVQVAKGSNPYGPFFNKKGENLNKVHDTWKILDSNDAFVGPGHVGEIITDDDGNEWIIYHSYVRGFADKYQRVLMLDRVTWDANEYPVINGGLGPSSSSAAPYFK